MTKTQKKNYLKTPSKCPYCGSENLDCGTMQVDGKDAWQSVECNDCHAQWRDVYKLADVESVALPDKEKI